MHWEGGIDREKESTYFDTKLQDACCTWSLVSFVYSEVQFPTFLLCFLYARIHLSKFSSLTHIIIPPIRYFIQWENLKTIAQVWVLLYSFITENTGKALSSVIQLLCPQDSDSCRTQFMGLYKNLNQLIEVKHLGLCERGPFPNNRIS